MRLSTRLTFLAALAFLILAAAPPASAVSGRVLFKTSIGGEWLPGRPYTAVKLCSMAHSGAWSGQGLCYTTTTDSNGGFTLSVPSGSYATFVWNNIYTYGSASSAAWAGSQDFNGYWTFSNQLNVDEDTGNVSLNQVEWPFRPLAVYPANGARKTPFSFTLKWTSDSSGFPVIYDLYASGDGGAEALVLSGLSCNPDASGNCTLPITNLPPDSTHTWRMVAKLHPSWPDPPSNIYVTNSSAEFSFATQGTTYSLTTVNGDKVSADNCGGSTVSARGTAVGNCETLRLVDLNGGTLQSGDSITLRVYATNWYFTAQNGGGAAMLANSLGGTASETFVLSKTTGSGTISNGDTVSLRASNGNYCSAELGGGDVVNCNRVTVGPWETFTFGVMP
ncbi:MAG TPA: hypothetical protein VGK45_00460 [Thermoanaerobaculia bacterium]